MGIDRNFGHFKNLEEKTGSDLGGELLSYLLCHARAFPLMLDGCCLMLPYDSCSRISIEGANVTATLSDGNVLKGSFPADSSVMVRSAFGELDKKLKSVKEIVISCDLLRLNWLSLDGYHTRVGDPFDINRNSNCNFNGAVNTGDYKSAIDMALFVGLYETKGINWSYLPGKHYAYSYWHAYDYVDLIVDASKRKLIIKDIQRLDVGPRTERGVSLKLHASNGSVLSGVPVRVETHVNGREDSVEGVSWLGVLVRTPRGWLYAPFREGQNVIARGS